METNHRRRRVIKIYPCFTNVSSEHRFIYYRFYRQSFGTNNILKKHYKTKQKRFCQKKSLDYNNNRKEIMLSLALIFYLDDRCFRIFKNLYFAVDQRWYIEMSVPIHSSDLSIIQKVLTNHIAADEIIIVMTPYCPTH